MFFERLGYGIDKYSIPKNIEIFLNKKMSQTISEVKNSIKEETCFYCGKQVSSFCKSHNVPRFCLENIGIDGEVSGPNAILGLPQMGISIGKEHLGISEAGTFKLICRECDSQIFKEYENPNNYISINPPSQKMLAEIAMKNYLKFISKRKFEIALLEKMIEQCPKQGYEYRLLSIEFETRLKVSKLDLESYTNEYRRAKKLTIKNNNDFYIIYYRLLNYVTPVAMQAPIVVSIDLEGGVVNDIFNMDPKYKPAELHLCVFPLKAQTAIIMFINDGEKRYKNFYKQFRKYNEDEKLGIINYLIFLYCEDFFFSKEIQSRIDLNQLKNVANLTPVIWDAKPVTQTKRIAEEFALSKWNTIPNLLSESYKLR